MRNRGIEIYLLPQAGRLKMTKTPEPSRRLSQLCASAQAALPCIMLALACSRGLPLATRYAPKHAKLIRRLAYSCVDGSITTEYASSLVCLLFCFAVRISSATAQPVDAAVSSYLSINSQPEVAISSERIEIVLRLMLSVSRTCHSFYHAKQFE